MDAIVDLIEEFKYEALPFCIYQHRYGQLWPFCVWMAASAPFWPSVVLQGSLLVQFVIVSVQLASDRSLNKYVSGSGEQPDDINELPSISLVCSFIVKCYWYLSYSTSIIFCSLSETFFSSEVGFLKVNSKNKEGKTSFLYRAQWAERMLSFNDKSNFKTFNYISD